MLEKSTIPGRSSSPTSVLSEKTLPVPTKVVNGKTVVVLKLEDFIRLSQLYDTVFMSYKEALMAAEESLKDTLRSYRPVFGGSISASYDPKNDTESQGLNFSLSQSLPWQGSLNLTNSASRTHSSSPPDTESISFKSALSLSFDILLRPGGYAEWRERMISAERAWVYAQRSFRANRENYCIERVNEFFSIINAGKALANDEKRLIEARNKLDVARFEYNRGRRSIFDVYTAEENLISTEQSINERQENYEQLIDNLKIKLGIPQEYDLELIEEPIFVEPVEIDVDETIKAALANNPSYQTERDKFEDRRRTFMTSLYALRVAPRLSLSYNVPLLDENSEDAENTNSSWSAVISWSYSLDQESRKNSYRSLLQSWTIYERDFKRKQEENIKDIRRQVRRMQTQRRALLNAERQLDTALRRKEGADLEYENNTISATDYNNALNAVTNAQDALNTARLNYKIEYLRYLSLIGELRIDEEGEWLK
ncbi:MAG: hypothetical protein Kow00107_11760 [Planctomycetota bacterium]